MPALDALIPVVSEDDMVARNADWIIPTAWREEGSTVVLARLKALQERNEEEREKRRKRAETDEAFRDEELQRCANDVCYWLIWYGSITNANEQICIPFLPFEAQVRKIIWPIFHDLTTPLKGGRADKRHYIIKKPRYMGISFTILEAGAIWGALFHQYWDNGAPFLTLLGADLEKNLDKPGDPETHFGRMEGVLSRLPKWMIPGGKFSRTNLKISILKNQSSIIGKALNRNFGRAQRSTLAMVDEEAFARDARAAITSLHDNTNRIWRVSTVNGLDESFARTWNDLDLKINRIDLNWRDCPWYDDEWYEAEKATRTKEQLAQEIDGDFTASAGNRCWDEFSPAINIVEEVPFLEGQPLWVGIDVGRADGTALTWWQVDYEKGLHLCHGYLYRPEAKLNFILPFLLGKIPDRDKQGNAYVGALHWGEPEREFIQKIGGMMAKASHTIYVGGSDLAQDLVHTDSLVQILARQWGLSVCALRIRSKQEAVTKVAVAVPYMRMSKQTAYGKLAGSRHALFDVFTQYRWKDRQPGEADDHLLPVHNEYSNGADSIQYYIQKVGLLSPKLAMPTLSTTALPRDEGKIRRAVYARYA